MDKEKEEEVKSNNNNSISNSVSNIVCMASLSAGARIRDYFA